MFGGITEIAALTSGLCISQLMVGWHQMREWEIHEFPASPQAPRGVHYLQCAQVAKTLRTEVHLVQSSELCGAWGQHVSNVGVSAHHWGSAHTQGDSGDLHGLKILHCSQFRRGRCPSPWTAGWEAGLDCPFIVRGAKVRSSHAEVNET